jgi:hypothetical protein
LIGTSAMTATINIATTGVAFAPPLVPKSMPTRPVFLRLRFNLPWAGLLLWTIPLLTLLAIIAGRHRRPTWRTLMAGTMLVLLWAGCGGSRSQPPGLRFQQAKTAAIWLLGIVQTLCHLREDGSR